MFGCNVFCTQKIGAHGCQTVTIESLDQGFFLTQTQQLETGPNLVILDLMKMTCYFPNGKSITWGIYRDYFSFFWVSFYNLRKTYDSAAEPNQRCTRYCSQDLFRTMPCSLLIRFPGWLGQWLKPKGKPRLIRPLRIAVSCRCGCWSEVAHAMLSIWRTNSICHKMGAHSLFLCLEVWCLENSWLHHRHSWRPWLDVFSGPGVTNMAAKITIIRRSPDSCVSNCWYFLFFVVVKTFYSSIWIIRFAEKGYWCKTSSCASLNLIIVCVQMDCHFRSRRTLQSSIIFDRWQMFG